MQVFGESLGLEAARQAQRIEGEGFDGLVAVDHFFSGQPQSQPRWRVEPLVALGAAASATSRITLAAMVMNVNFHHPAVLAHAIASLDEMSGGRAELGLGGGWYRPEHVAFGLPWGSGPERGERLLEAAKVCRAMLENMGAVSHRGAHFQVENDVSWEWEPNGRPVPVVIGGSRESLLVRAAEVANRVDLLHASVGGGAAVDAETSRPVERVEAMASRIRASAAQANNTISISATITALVVPDSEAAGARARFAPSLRSTPALLERDLLYVVGTQAELFERVRDLHALGVDRIHVIPGRVEPQRTLAAVRDMLPDIHRL